VLAVLDATNRIFEPYAHRTPPYQGGPSPT
jgi:hypothetical protein